MSEFTILALRKSGEAVTIRTSQLSSAEEYFSKLIISEKYVSVKMLEGRKLMRSHG